MMEIFSNGLAFAVLGAAVAAALAGIGSACGVQLAGKASAGVASDKPELFGKLLVLQILPGTQGLYGLIAAFFVMMQTGLLGGATDPISVETGLAYFFASLPIGIVGLLSGIYQGKTAAAAIQMTGKQPTASAKGITMTALVETYAILALLLSILLYLAI